MKKKILLLMGVFAFGLLYAQIGINTDAPLALFHIDGKGDNSSSPTALEVLNDFVITSDGNVGIGVTNPTVKLHVETGGISSNVVKGFQLQDGSEGINKYLRSDPNGVARWESANDNKLRWGADHRFTIPTTCIYLITLYITSQSSTLPYTNVWAGATMDSPHTGLNGVALFSYTRNDYIITNCNQVNNANSYCSGTLFLTAGEIVGPRSMSFYGTGTPTLYIELVPF